MYTWFFCWQRAQALSCFAVPAYEVFFRKGGGGGAPLLGFGNGGEGVGLVEGSGDGGGDGEAWREASRKEEGWCRREAGEKGGGGGSSGGGVKVSGDWDGDGGGVDTWEGREAGRGGFFFTVRVELFAVAVALTIIFDHQSVP